jgi:putative Mn2+ efflux pump MntP
MGLLELLLIAAGLSMDAFAASLCTGLGMGRLSLKNSLITALFFGGFQAAMPFIGWLLGKQFENYITSIDHWVAFGLLAFIGSRMIFETFKKGESSGECEAALNLKHLTLMAVATSIDALAVGVTFAFLHVSIVPSVLTIGLVTFALTLIGVLTGYKLGARLKTKAELAGGAVLILIGAKILLEHLGVL